jgi:DinB superfamily
MKKKILAILSAVVVAVFALAFAPKMQAQSSANASASPTPASVMNQLITAVEEELVPLADAMPADKYNFAPTTGNFKGVRTFGQQVAHVAMGNYYLFSAASGLHPTMPKMADLKTKDQIVQALKDSFVFAHKAAATLNGNNALEKIKPIDGQDTRGGLMAFGVVHMNDHFGQMVIYARMNSIVPPSSMPRGK